MLTIPVTQTLTFKISVIEEGIVTQISFKQSAFPGVAALKSLNESFLLFQSIVTVHSDFNYTP